MRDPLFRFPWEFQDGDSRTWNQTWDPVRLHRLQAHEAHPEGKDCTFSTHTGMSLQNWSIK